MEEQEEKIKKDETENQEGKSEGIPKWGKFVKVFLISIIVALVLIVLGFNGYRLYEKYRHKFKSIEVEIGSTSSVSVKDFLISEEYEYNSEMITDLGEVDYSKIGEYTVTLKHDNRKETVTLRVVDTTPPEVEFQDISKYIDYEINPDDFIVKKSDLTEMRVEVQNAPEITEFTDYDVTISVKDTSGNETSKTCKLTIEWIKKTLSVETGDKINKEDLLYNVEEDGNLLDEAELNKIANSDNGEYEVKTEKDGKEATTIIKVTDLTPPTLVLKNVSIYTGDTVTGADSFIKSVSDASGDVTTVLKTDINYSHIGTQEIVIEASDKYGNKVEKTCKLTIKKDTEGPVFSGLSEISVEVGGSVDYKANVKAKDGKDGTCEFTVDSSKVDLNTIGTYYATYTSSDKTGNTTTKERKITVKEKDITYMIDNFPVYYQFPNYPNGCESVALYTLLKYYNVNVTVEGIVDKLKKGDAPYTENGVRYGGNPEVEFVGNPKSKSGYGCYQKPIINVANAYKSGMIDYTGHSLNQVLELVKNGTPVQVWVSINLQNSWVSQTWIDKSTGKTIKWLRHLHSVVIVGYNSSYVWVSDPYVGKTVKYKRSQFQKIYNLFGKRAIYYNS